MKYELLDPALWMDIQHQLDNDFGVGVTKELAGALLPISLESESGTLIYLGSMDWIDVIEQGLGSYELYSFGLFLGEMIKEKLRLSISVLSRIAPLTDSRIVIAEKAAGAYTYGKSILKESVLEAKPDLKKGQRVIVLNEKHDCLGLATLTADGYKISKMRPNDLVAKNIVDIGLYIRKLF
jgi:ribosome biogenesis protein Nip4